MSERDELERLRAEVERLKIEAVRYEMESALSAVHAALGGDGEWACRVPSPPPPDSGNLSLDVPVLAAQALARAEAAERDAERLDFVERHLCRAGDVLDQNGQVTGIMKCWQVVTQCDDSLRDTIDLLRAAIDAAQKEGLA